MRSSAIVIVFFAFAFTNVLGQGITRQTYHDAEKKHLKEVYQVSDADRNILHGRYISYHLNGKVESKGQFTANETSGVWEFYYETGNLKMRGILFKGANYGLWEYFYESGEKSMEGIIYGKNREGEWKMFYENGQLKEIGEYTNNKRNGLWKYYFEDGNVKGEIDYTDEFGRYIEYYHNGKVMGEGPRVGTKNAGHWRFYAEDGTLQSEGEFENGKKHGSWTNYYPTGKIASKGQYENDEPSGIWSYHFENGNVSSSGEFISGKKHGYWKSFNSNGSVKSEATYSEGTGEYREYYAGGKLKVKGLVREGKRQGTWEFYFEDGKIEGTCEYERNKGTFYGYYPNGNLHTKGTLEDELKTGTWEIYHEDGTLSGYYKPFYENRKLAREITELATRTVATKSSTRAKRSYFDARANEFKGVIVGSNPLWLAAGRIPVGIEFYLQERLGHEFEFVGIRDPFFKADENVAAGKQFRRGYSVSIKQKLYNTLKAGMWYVGQEIRFTNLGHFVNQPLSQNPDNVFTFTAVEQRIEWGVLIGYRIMKRNNTQGFTIDAFASGNIGYRGFDVDRNYASFFENINQSKLSTSFNFGLNFGHVFSFK